MPLAPERTPRVSTRGGQAALHLVRLVHRGNVAIFGLVGVDKPTRSRRRLHRCRSVLGDL